MHIGDTIYVLREHQDFRFYQVKAILEQIRSIPGYPRGRRNLYTAKLGDGKWINTYWNVEKGGKKHRAIRKTPFPNLPLYCTTAEVRKGEIGTLLICIEDDCPRGGIVDYCICQRCEYHNHRAEANRGISNCTHPSAESDPDDTRVEVPTCLDLCERCRDTDGEREAPIATQTIFTVYDERPRRYCDGCAKAGRMLGWIKT